MIRDIIKKYDSEMKVVRLRTQAVAGGSAADDRGASDLSVSRLSRYETELAVYLHEKLGFGRGTDDNSRFFYSDLSSDDRDMLLSMSRKILMEES